MSAIHASRSEQDTFDAGVRIGAALRPGDMVLLEGELGAGKTAMVRGIAQALGIERRAVSSPTFTIVHEHGFDGGTMYHIDAYRLSGVEELEAVGWEAIMDDPGRIVVCEWPQRIAEAVESGVLRVELRHVGPQERDIMLHASDDGGAARFASILES
ncbi:MAG: tRNA (adenosine(37)-N6)-threonylcarbamoyltransferase complex ATPase subunit type 1 TsaE [Planctomycetota bacterium]|nr:tRNA (adenosine(37)-N6)-threonylcarbamoyltransferase complex ATPase subunit type 1 TsaE [Planctomycetota bacterium]